MMRSALVVIFLSACGFTADPQIASIEVKDPSGNTLTITKYDIEYSSGGKLQTISVTVAGQLQRTYTIEYSGDHIDTVSRADNAGATDRTYTFSYKGDDVTEEVRTDTANGSTRTTLFEYDGEDRLEKVTENANDNDTTNDDVTTFEYDGKGRLERTLEQPAGGTATVSTINYEDDEGFGELDSIKVEDGGTPATVGFKYDDARRLERVNEPNLSQSVTYNDKGLAEEIKQSSGNLTVTTTFEYNDDDGIEGADARMPVSFGSLFTLDGRRVDDLDVMTSFINALF